MANADCKIKEGMGGSRCGRGRYEKTEVLKSVSKKQRRQLGTQEAANQFREMQEEDDE